MSRSRWGLKNPEKFLFNMPLEAAELFRRHCAENQYTIGKVLTDLVINHLVTEGVIDTQTAFLIRQGSVLTPRAVEREQQRAQAASALEAATKEAQEFNSKIVKTGKKP